MKKLVLMVMLFTMSNVIAQVPTFGIKAGFNSLSVKASAGDISASESISGFYIGTFADLVLSNTFNLQPEFQYVYVFEDGENSSLINVPIMLKYKPTPQFNILVGPQFDYLLDEEADGIKRLGLGLGTGLSYNITTEIIIDARYIFGLTNRLKDNNFDGMDIDTKFNYLQIGLCYKY